MRHTTTSAHGDHLAGSSHAAQTTSGLPIYDSWSACQANTNPDMKEWMANYFAAHDFLVREGRNGEIQQRERVAHIFVAPGTTPNTVVRICIEWMKENWEADPFTVTWYPLGGLIPATLFEFKQKNGHCASGARLFLFPGVVDPLSETMTGKYTVQFLKNLKRKRLNVSILSTHRFNMATGDAYFYFDDEAESQRIGAKLYADDKFLFLDPDKFTSIGGSMVYNARDLLETSQSVTIYTVTSAEDRHIEGQFKLLYSRILMPCDRQCDEQQGDVKSLRLCIVSKSGEAVKDLKMTGLLASKDQSGSPASRPPSPGRARPRLEELAVAPSTQHFPGRNGQPPICG